MSDEKLKHGDIVAWYSDVPRHLGEIDSISIVLTVENSVYEVGADPEDATTELGTLTRGELIEHKVVGNIYDVLQAFMETFDNV